MANSEKTIMVVEDEEALLQVITKKLRSEGYKTVSCVSAEQALDYLGSTDQKPDLIWLDYYLGKMNGLEFMDKLNEKEDLKVIPVIVVSNSASQDKVETMLKKGVKKYILKAEFSLKDLVDIVDKFIRKVGEYT